jgi:O-antigen/teichoic acid export membrane protein
VRLTYYGPMIMAVDCQKGLGDRVKGARVAGILTLGKLIGLTRLFRTTLAQVKFDKLRALVSDSIRLRSLKLKTEHERACERHHRAAYTATASVLARAIGLGTTLITIRMTLSYLGTERFGLWMTISSLQAFFSFADLGIGNGLLNVVADANGKDDARAIRQCIDSGMLLLALISGMILLTLVSSYHILQFGRFFNVHSALAISEVGPAIAVFTVCFAVAIPFGLVHRVQCGLQLGFLSSLWQIAGSLLALAGVLVVIHLRGGLPVLVLAFCGAPLLAKLVNGCVFFGWMQPDLLPTFRLASWSAIRKIGRLAFLFVVLNIGVALAFQSDNLIITHILDPEAVAQYSVPQKLFSLISLGIATLIEPLWPAYGEAIARGDGHWVKRTLVRSVIGAVSLASLMGVTFVFLGPKLIHLWVGDKAHASLVLLIGFACWAVMQAGGSAVSMFLNGASIVKLQVIIGSIFAICALVVKITFVRHWGIDAMPWATLASYLFFIVLPYAVMVPGIASRVCNPELASAAILDDISAQQPV